MDFILNKFSSDNIYLSICKTLQYKVVPPFKRRSLLRRSHLREDLLNIPLKSPVEYIIKEK